MTKKEILVERDRLSKTDEVIRDTYIVWYDPILDQIYISPIGERDDQDSVYIGRL